MSMLQIELDEELLARIEQRAARSGKPRSEVIAEALRRELEGGRLREILDSAGGLDRLSEDEAMQLAISELKASRAQRTAGDHG
jgi:metal-responsive CopG/Arc/MetJ family transcriptional regulator